MRYRIQHETRYSGTEPVSIGHNEARLTPRALPHQTRENYELRLQPAPSIRSTRVDYFGNEVELFSFNQGYTDLKVTAVSTVRLFPRSALPADRGPAWESVRDRIRTHGTASDLAAYEFTFDSPRAFATPELDWLTRGSFTPGRPIVAALQILLQLMKAEFEFDSDATHVGTSLLQVLRLRRGVCQDFAHLVVAALRSVGLPARYVSGYLRTYPPAGQPRLFGADASHAWVAVYCGELGWVDLDPTNNAFANLEHITLGWGRDYDDVAPLKGVFVGGGTHHLTVSVDVEPLEEMAEPPAGLS